MKFNSIDSRGFTQRAPIALALAMGSLVTGCFSEEVYGNETPFVLPALEDPSGAAAAPGSMPSGPAAGTMDTNTPTGGTMGAAGTPAAGTGSSTEMPMAGTGGPTPDGGMAGTGEPLPPASCDGEIECVGGMAGQYPCSGVNLLAHLDGPSMQGGTGNDIWGWTDSTTGKEYVMMGLTNGTAFVDISNPCNPIHLGHLRTETVDATWRDIKIYKDHAFIVSESAFHGMQVFDLSRLRSVASPPMTFTADNVITTFGATHNIVLNEESGYAYTVLANNCASARSFDLSNPKAPVDKGCWGTTARIHDAHCVNYHGPDAAYAGKEICFTGDEGRGVGIYDVTDKANVKQIGGLQYPNVDYGHQGWMTEDHAYFVFGDEGDEIGSGIKTTTYFVDTSVLTKPTMASTFVNTTASTDHNIFVRGNYAFLASYSAGLRILDLTGIATGGVTEVGFFDGYPAHNNSGYNAMWGVYPFFQSGVVVTSGSEGLFITRPNPDFMQ